MIEKVKEIYIEFRLDVYINPKEYRDNPSYEIKEGCLFIEIEKVLLQSYYKNTEIFPLNNILSIKIKRE